MRRRSLLFSSQAQLPKQNGHRGDALNDSQGSFSRIMCSSSPTRGFCVMLVCETGMTMRWITSANSLGLTSVRWKSVWR